MDYENQESDGPDVELQEALEALRDLSQRTIAREIGISERRFRDIERGRTTPRRRTREAIINLAEDVHAGRGVDETVPAEQSASETVGPWIFGALAVLGLIAVLISLCRRPDV